MALRTDPRKLAPQLLFAHRPSQVALYVETLVAGTATKLTMYGCPELLPFFMAVKASCSCVQLKGEAKKEKEGKNGPSCYQLHKRGDLSTKGQATQVVFQGGGHLFHHGHHATYLAGSSLSEDTPSKA
jgi:hypothetical protein